MADVFTFFVYDDRSIQFELAEPIMLEDTNVTQFRFRIPKSINGFDMTDWAWWFVYVNAQKEKFSVPLSFTDDEDEPDEYANAVYTVDYGMSGTAGTISFALEAINADATTSEILNEWHTKTYTTKVLTTLQGNQTEFTPSEFDIISAKLEEILELIEGGIGGGTSDDIKNVSSVSGSTVSDALNSLSDEIASVEGGAPTPAATVSAMVDTTKIYLYTGSETGYNAGHWYYYSGGQWVDGGQYGEAASMSAGVKAALLACFQKVAWIDDQGQTYYDNLYNELYPPANLVSITAVYTQSGTVYAETSLDDLKPDLVVTANFSDGTSQTVTTYTLSGTLAEGTSVITVAYDGKTATFNVTVSETPLDTTAQLDTAHMGEGQSNRFGNYSNKTGFCPTIKYEMGALGGVTYDYLNGIIPVDSTGSSTSRIWFYREDETGDTASAYGSGKPINVYSDSMTEGRVAVTVAQNYVSMTIPVHVDYLADSYLYVQSSGKVLFAGSNTPYYGMANISEAT